MEKIQIEELIKSAVELDELIVTVNDSHANVIAVSDVFSELSRVKKQQLIYKPLSASIQDGTLHAVSIKTFTNTEWTREKKFNQPL